jgi:hypothetical protein
MKITTAEIRKGKRKEKKNEEFLIYFQDRFSRDLRTGEGG